MTAASTILSAPAAPTALPVAEAGTAATGGAAFGALIDAATSAGSATPEAAAPMAVAPAEPTPAPETGQSLSTIAPPVDGEIMPVPEAAEAEALPVTPPAPEPALAEAPALALAPPPPAASPPPSPEKIVATPAAPPVAQAMPPVAQPGPPAASVEKPVGKEKAPKEPPLAEVDAPKAEMLRQAVPPLPMQAAVAPVAPHAQPAPTAETSVANERVEAAPDRPVATRAARANSVPAAPGAALLDNSKPAAATRSATMEPPAGAPAAAPDKTDNSLSSPLLTQTLAPVISRPAASPYPATAQTAAAMPVVQAQPGRIGTDMGVEIARAAKGEREDLLIRLDPRAMGRINVRLSFEHDGTLRAVMSADSPAALDMLRRESGDLNRALVDAGIRSDGQSLRFDTRTGDQGQGHGQGQNNPRGQQQQSGGQRLADDSASDFIDPHYRPLRASGQVDLMA